MTPNLHDMHETLHLDEASVPWVELQPGLRLRLLHARPAENFVVQQFEVAPGLCTALHRHLSPVFGYTLKGRWGHDETYSYRPGSYIYETPGVLHRFYNGPETTQALFILYGLVETVDPQTGAVIAQTGPADVLRSYFELCDKAGLPRPSILN